MPLFMKFSDGELLMIEVGGSNILFDGILFI